MKKVFKLKESELIKIIEKVVKEQTDERYMFFSNLEQIQFDFLMNETKSFHKMGDELGTAPKEDQLVMGEGKKKAGTKLCSRGKSAAKSKFKVYPSAYANGYAVQVCKGSMPGLDGKKRCSPPYC